MRTTISKVLLSKGMGQGELAKKVDVKREYINRIINSRISPSVYLALRISKVLDVPVEELFIPYG